MEVDLPVSAAAFRAIVIEYLRSLPACGLYNLMMDAKVAKCWCWYDDEGGPVDPEEEEDGEDGCPPMGGYLESYAGLCFGDVHDAGDSWTWRAYTGSSEEDVSGEAPTQQEAAEAVERVVAAWGCRIPWSEQP